MIWLLSFPYDHQTEENTFLGSYSQLVRMIRNALFQKYVFYIICNVLPTRLIFLTFFSLLLGSCYCLSEKSSLRSPTMALQTHSLIQKSKQTQKPDFHGLGSGAFWGLHDLPTAELKSDLGAKAFYFFYIVLMETRHLYQSRYIAKT